MPDQPLHTDLGGYLIGRLEPAEQARVEQHLTTCEECSALVRELSGTAASLDRIAPAFELPAALEARTFAAVENDARNGFTPPARPAPRWWTRRPVRRAGLALAAAAIAVAAAFAGAELGDRGREGALELQAALSAPDGGAESGTAAVTKTGIGRVIEFRSDNLPILPKGEYYELWFVGPGDTLERPNRISAGTFHPDEDGRSHVRFAAAVDPAKYPVISVTSEPGDGNPQRTGVEVLRSTGRG